MPARLKRPASAIAALALIVALAVACAPGNPAAPSDGGDADKIHVSVIRVLVPPHAETNTLGPKIEAEIERLADKQGKVTTGRPVELVVEVLDYQRSTGLMSFLTGVDNKLTTRAMLVEAGTGKVLHETPLDASRSRDGLLNAVLPGPSDEEIGIARDIASGVQKRLLAPQKVSIALGAAGSASPSLASLPPPAPPLLPGQSSTAPLPSALMGSTFDTGAEPPPRRAPPPPEPVASVPPLASVSAPSTAAPRPRQAPNLAFELDSPTPRGSAPAASAPVATARVAPAPPPAPPQQRSVVPPAAPSIAASAPRPAQASAAGTAPQRATAARGSAASGAKQGAAGPHAVYFGFVATRAEAERFAADVWRRNGDLLAGYAPEVRPERVAGGKQRFHILAPNMPSGRGADLCRLLSERNVACWFITDKAG